MYRYILCIILSNSNEMANNNNNRISLDKQHDYNSKKFHLRSIGTDRYLPYLILFMKRYSFTHASTPNSRKNNRKYAEDWTHFNKYFSF